MSLLESVVLAVVEGLTEFLPVSSTGHMIIASSVMGIAEDPFTKAFIVAIQLGAILSVVLLYWKRFLPGKDASKTIDFYSKLFVAFLPALVLGLLLSRYIHKMLGQIEVVGLMLILGGIILLFIDKAFKATAESGKDEISYPTALKIGLFQTIAMVPGVSRSAATIVGGMTQKLNRKSAAEFSFFLAVPTMFGATALELFKFYRAGNGFSLQEIQLLAVGSVVAFIVALLAIKTFIQFLTRYGFKAFGYYRIAVGTIILLLYYLGVELSNV